MPKNSNTQDLIRARVDAFVDELTELVHQAAIEAVHEAMGMAAPTASRAPRQAAKAPAKKKGASKKRKKAGRRGGKRVRRSREDLEGLKNDMVGFVAANPGCKMSDLVAQFGVEPPTIRGPLNELLAGGQLRKEGERRGTTYFAGKKGRKK